MTNATELLRRVIQAESHEMLDDVLEEIEIFLATEPEAEPVFIRPDHLALARKSPFLCQVGPVLVADFIPLYTRSLSAIRKPMTDREIMDLAKSLGFNDITTMDFAIGVRYAEKHHFGIGGDDA